MDPEAFKNHVLEKYATGLVHLEHVLAAKPHFMANYLVNQMFNEAFPFNEPGIFESYLRLISRFGTLRMLLALRCSYVKQLPSPSDLAVLTQVYARNFEHDRSFKDAINQALHQAGFDSMKYIVGIIRD
jgi:lysine-N-methylase